jgi:hypothetical protein
MSGRDKALQVGSGAMVRVDGIQVLCPVAVVTTSTIFFLCERWIFALFSYFTLTRNHRCDPDSIKTKAFDIVEFRLEPLECTTTVVSQVAASSATSVAAATSDAVRQDKVDAARFPGIGVGG